MVIVPALLYIAPPLPVALLPVNTESVMFKVPALEINPPLPVVLKPLIDFTTAPVPSSEPTF